MKNKIIFGRWEAVSLMLTLFCTQLFLNFPRNMADSAGNAGWMLVIYVTILVLIIFKFMSKLHSRFEGMDILDISERVAGSIGRITTGVIIIGYLLFIVSIVLREYAENVKLVSLPTSPISYTMIFFAACMVVGVYMGFEAIVRLGAILVPIIAVGYIIILIGVSQYLDASNLMPLFGLGTKKIFIDGISRISIFSAVSVMFLITPFIGTERNFRRVGYYSIILASIILAAGTFIYMLVFPYPASTESVLPIYTLTRLISYGRFFQRIESIFVLIWDASAAMYLSAVLFLAVYVFKKAFKLEYHKPLIIPFTIIIFNLSLLPPNLMSAVQLETQYFRNLAWVVSFAYITLVMLIALIFKKGVKKEGEKSEKKKA